MAGETDRCILTGDFNKEPYKLINHFLCDNADVVYAGNDKVLYDDGFYITEPLTKLLFDYNTEGWQLVFDLAVDSLNHQREKNLGAALAYAFKKLGENIEGGKGNYCQSIS